MSEVLAELKAEYQQTAKLEIVDEGYKARIRSTGGLLIFTRDDKPIPAATLRHAFDKAVKDAKVDGFLLKDFRHVARTRWSLGGLPIEVCEIGMGHSLKGLAKVYSNPTDDQIRQAWQKLYTTCEHGKVDASRQDRRDSAAV